MPTIFVTGFPGFLGSELIARLLGADESTRVACLVQPHYLEEARRRRTALPRVLQHRLHFVEGDITRDGLGIETGSVDTDDIREIFHLAAVYDLAVDRETAMRVNLDGTRRVIDFAHGCRSLSRLHYVSTCYVSGRFDGTFSEEDLVCGQEFNNHYEESKYRAEVEVQAAMRNGMPGTVYRPSIVVGHSRTGATQKFDGPYPLLRWMMRFPAVTVLPVVGRPSAYHVNFVPSDYVVEALFALSRRADTAGGVFHLSDPNPLTVSETIDVLGAAVERRVLRVPTPMPAARGIVGLLARFDRGLGLHPSVLDYFRHPARYASDRTREALSGTGITCPPFASYVDRLIDFVRDRPDLNASGMR